VTPAPGPGAAAGRPPGVRASARRVVAHARSLVRLERELARAELQRKGQSAGAGAALAVAALVFALFALGFGLAAVAAALALVMDWWLALLIVFCILLVAVVALGFASQALLREGTPFRPEQAIEEARRTRDVLRGADGA
jgi:uncharacterized membrane protein YqjE